MTTVRGLREPRSASRDAEVAPQRDSSLLTATFWSTHVKIGCALFGLESVATMVYLAMTPHGARRVDLWGVAAACALLAVIATLMALRLPSHLQKRFSITWTLVASVALALGACLDGGITSPLVSLLWLPIVYAGLALEPVPTAVTGVIGGAELVAAVVVAGGSAPTGLTIIAGAAMVGAVALAVATSANRTRLEESQRSLTSWLGILATVDGLTGCLNWRTFGERLVIEVARSVRYDQPLSLIMIDLDDFKSVNDRGGHLRGDAVLARVGVELLAECRRTDVVGRVGGDEFAIYLPQTSAEGARSVAERVLGRIAGLESPPITLSIGVAELDPGDATADRLMSDADYALYGVKHHGGNAFAVSDGVDQASQRCPILAIGNGRPHSRGVLPLYQSGHTSAR